MLGTQENIAKIILIAALLSLSGLGCAVGSDSSKVTMSNVPAPAMAEHSLAVFRAGAALERLRFAYQGHACVRVSDSEKPAAYSWSDGTICLATGLIRLLNDDEIAAVISHELGHLTYAEDNDARRFALGGSGTEDEQRADAVGIILLRLSGIPAASLAHALTKVRDAPNAPTGLREAITLRIARLPQ